MSMNVSGTLQSEFMDEGIEFLNSLRDPSRKVSTDEWLEDIVRSLTTTEIQETYQAYMNGDISEGAAYALLGDDLYDTEETSVPVHGQDHSEMQWSSTGKAF